MMIVLSPVLYPEWEKNFDSPSLFARVMGLIKIIKTKNMIHHLKDPIFSYHLGQC